MRVDLMLAALSLGSLILKWPLRCVNSSMFAAAAAHPVTGNFRDPAKHFTFILSFTHFTGRTCIYSKLHSALRHRLLPLLVAKNIAGTDVQVKTLSFLPY